MIFGEHALSCATKLVAKWGRSNSCSAMFLCQRQSAAFSGPNHV